MKKILGFIFNANNIISRIICALIYILVYDYAFREFVYRLFYYMGIDYIDMTLDKFLSWAILSIIPILFYKRIQNLSSFFGIFLYVLVYIPFIHALFTMWNIGFFTMYGYGILLCAIFVLLLNIGNRKTFFKNIIIEPLIPFKWIQAFTIILTIVLVALSAGSMHFVNIFTQSDLMYQLRAENSESAGGGLLAYIKGWLFGGFYPFLLVNYLSERKWIKTAIVIGAYFLLFMIDMQKLTFFMPFALIVLYFVIRKERNAIYSKLHAFLMYFLSVSSLIIVLLKDEVLQLALGFIVILRTSAVAGWLSQYYLRFFCINDNPFTYYSHINIVNAITNKYPFNEPLGIAVAYGSQNANANLFLTDGMAAGGIFGVLFIGLLFYVLMHLINSVSYRYKMSDLLIIFLPTLSYILNTSIFTTLLSNGLLILIIIIAGTECPIDNRNSIKDEE